MPRPILDESHIHPAIREVISSNRMQIIDEVRAAVAKHDVVVVGMAQNPFPKKARKLLDTLGIAYHYLEYGSYMKDWRKRTALKMWTGWQTLPMIFIKGVLVGGANDLQKLADSGELKQLLAAPRPA